MAAPKLVSGILYFNRDRDYRSGEWGPYVKMGIVRKDRSAEDRAKEHQTGNPREVVTTHQLHAPMVEYLETQLHHRFARHWVSGEWFEMTREFVVDVVIPEAESIISQQNDFLEDFESKSKLKDVESNGRTREPTEEEQAVWENWKTAKEAFILADANKQLADLRLRTAVGGAGGISGVLKLIKKTSKAALDKKSLEATHAEIFRTFLIPKPSKVKGSLLGKGTLRLDKIDSDLASKLKSAKADKPTFTPGQLGDGIEPLSRTKEHEAKHAEFVESLGSVARAEWDVERWLARLARLLGEDEAIGNLVAWKRELAPQNPGFDQAGFKAAHPDLYDAFLKLPPPRVSVDILFNRPYPLG